MIKRLMIWLKWILNWVRISYIAYMDSCFHSLIPFLKATTLVYSFNCNCTISHILGPKYEMLSLPWKTDLTFGMCSILNCVDLVFFLVFSISVVYLAIFRKRPFFSSSFDEVCYLPWWLLRLNPGAWGEHLTSQFLWVAAWLLVIRVCPFYWVEEELVLLVSYVLLWFGWCVMMVLFAFFVWSVWF